ncbi:hypothetical protein [Roseivirga echinicomitans]|uniref:Uncharacterized protein n=1 Tax=Roseivirga echinicomitans TaxID=296218 RepID=A0A150X2N3_9BACT|nr:hypothetical protein [Roseivirga echinicomitans]KYG72976.1 hypothetical protein AWN68_09775 [Roseivirga echinicomitans]
MRILELYARLAKDTSTERSLFTGKFDSLKSISMKLSQSATGTAHFVIFQNNVEKISKDLTAGQIMSYVPLSNSIIEYQINNYNETDLPQVHIIIS